MLFFKNNSYGKNYHVFLTYFQSKHVKDILREMDIWILYFKLTCTSSPFHANLQITHCGKQALKFMEIYSIIIDYVLHIYNVEIIKRSKS